jgi:hypothetical protein
VLRRRKEGRVTSGSGDVRNRLAELDRLPAPDLWEEIKGRSHPTPVAAPVATHRMRSFAAAAAAVIVAFAGGFWLSRADSDRGSVSVSDPGSAADRSWVEIAAFPAEPENAGSAWLVAGDDAVVVAAFARDRHIRLFDADQSAAPRLISTPPVAAVASSDGVPIVLAQDGRLLVVGENTTREVARISPVERGAELAAANGRVWVARGGATPLTVVDLADGDVQEIDAVQGVDLVRAHAGQVWTSSVASRQLVLLDATNLRVLAQRQVPGVIAIDPVARGDAWILRSNGVEGEVLRLDGDLKPTHRDVVPSTTSDITITDGSVWTLDRGRLERTPIGEQRPAQITSIGATVGRLAIGHDALYVFGTDVRMLRPVGAR